MANGSKQDNTVPLIGTLAVKKQLISEEQLQKALAQCSDDNNIEEACANVTFDLPILLIRTGIFFFFISYKSILVVSLKDSFSTIL